MKYEKSSNFSEVLRIDAVHTGGDMPVYWEFNLWRPLLSKSARVSPCLAPRMVIAVLAKHESFQWRNRLNLKVQARCV